MYKAYDGFFFDTPEEALAWEAKLEPWLDRPKPPQEEEEKFDEL